MPDPIDLSGPVQEALDGAVLRGHQMALAYVREDGSPAATFRGSTHVHTPTELAIWVRKRDDGFAKAIAKEPRVSLVYADFDGPGARYVSIEGRARARDRSSMTRSTRRSSSPSAHRTPRRRASRW